MKKLIIYLALPLIVLGACKKYDEDPWISFRTKEKRIIGTWEVQAFYVNGYDSTQFFRKYDSPIFHTYKSLIFFTLDDLHRPPIHPRLYIAGNWDFEDNKNNFGLSFYSENELDENFLDFGPFRPSQYSKWEIKKLKMEEFNLETDFENSHYRLELKRI